MNKMKNEKNINTRLRKPLKEKKMFSFDTLSQMTTQMFFELLLFVAIGG